MNKIQKKKIISQIMTLNNKNEQMEKFKGWKVNVIEIIWQIKKLKINRI